MSLTYETRQKLRAARHKQAAATLGLEMCPNGYGSLYGYRKGCRCRPCTDLATADRRKRPR